MSGPISVAVIGRMTQNGRAGVDVSAETCVPAWDGEPMDDDLVVESLYQMESARSG